MLFHEELIMFQNEYIGTPLVWGHSFCTRYVAFQEDWPLLWGINQLVWIHIIKRPFQRGLSHVKATF